MPSRLLISLPYRACWHFFNKNHLYSEGYDFYFFSEGYLFSGASIISISKVANLYKKFISLLIGFIVEKIQKANLINGIKRFLIFRGKKLEQDYSFRDDFLFRSIVDSPRPFLYDERKLFLQQSFLLAFNFSSPANIKINKHSDASKFRGC